MDCDQAQQPPADAASSIVSRNLPARDLLDVSTTFTRFGAQYLDKRITHALTLTLNLKHPTLVQASAIPLLLQKKDVLIRSKTGTGKTLAYAIPLIQHCLSSHPNEVTPSFFSCVLVPTRELAAQVASVLCSLCEFCHSYITIRDTSSGISQLLKDAPPSVMVTTPKAFLMYLSSKKNEMQRPGTSKAAGRSFWRQKNPASPDSLNTIEALFRTNLRVFVLDEADALLALGFHSELQTIFHRILKSQTPSERLFQAVLCSATLSDEVSKLKSMVLYKPAVLHLKGADPVPNADLCQSGLFPHQGQSRLREFYLHCPSNDKFLIVYSLLKLSLLPLKCIIFVNSADRAYFLLLMLRRFGITATVLCETLPFSSRLVILESFQQGLSNILITVDLFEEDDETETQPKDHDAPVSTEPNENASPAASAEHTSCNAQYTSSGASEDLVKTLQPQRPTTQKKTGFGVQRGIDFKNVQCVLNFDLPSTLTSYIHRIGRTARAGASGVALTLCGMQSTSDTRLLESLLSSQYEGASTLSPLDLNLRDIECFRYRVQDVLQSITPKVIASMRAHDIQRELLRCKRLKDHFDTNPDDMKALKNAFKSIQLMKPDDRHLKAIPSYFESSVSHLCTSTAIEKALSRALEADKNSCTLHSKTLNGKRKHASSDVLRALTSRSKKRIKSVNALLVKNLANEPRDYSATPVDHLAPISSKKLKALEKKAKARPRRTFKRKALRPPQ